MARLVITQQRMTGLSDPLGTRCLTSQPPCLSGCWRLWPNFTQVPRAARGLRGVPRQPQRWSSAQHPRQRVHTWRCGVTVVPRPGGGASPGRGPLEKGDQPRFFAEPSLMTRLLLLLPRSPSRPVVPTLAPGAIHPDNMLACQPLPLLGLPGDAGRAGGSCLRSGRPHSTQNRAALRGSWGVPAGGSPSLPDKHGARVLTVESRQPLQGSPVSCVFVVSARIGCCLPEPGPHSL